MKVIKKPWVQIPSTYLLESKLKIYQWYFKTQGIVFGLWFGG